MSIQERPNEMRNWSIVMITFLLLLLLSLAVTIYLTYRSLYTPGSTIFQQSKIRASNREYLKHMSKIVFVFCLTLDITSLFTLYTEDIKNTNTAINIVSVLSVITLLWYLFWFLLITASYKGKIKMGFTGNELSKVTLTIITLSLWTLILFSVSYFLYIKNVLGSILNIKESNNIYMKTIFSLTVINDFLLLILILVLLIYKIYGGNLYTKIFGGVKQDGELSTQSLVTRFSDMSIKNII